MLYCKNCLLPEYKPYIEIGESGMCNVCQEFDRNTLQFPLEIELARLINRYRNKKKGKYDCLVLCSGGKDSLYALYYMKTKYKLTPLVFTFDFGFENEQALQNVQRAVDILKVDWLYFKTDFMKEVFRKIIQTQSKVSLCHVCTLGYMELSYQTAIKYGIPIIIGGWTKSQSILEKENMLEYLPFSQATYNFVKKVLSREDNYKNFPCSLKELQKKYRKKFRGIILSPLWYIKSYPQDRIRLVKEKLHWENISLSYPKDSTNCLLNFVNVYLCMRNYGYTHYHIEESRAIRLGEISKKEAEEKLKINFDKDFINNILKKIDCKI